MLMLMVVSWRKCSTNCFPLTLTIYHKFVENLLYFWDARLTCICIKHFITCELENLSFQTRIFQEALNAKPRIWVNICWRKVFFKNGLMYRHTASSTLLKILDDRKIGAKDFSNPIGSNYFSVSLWCNPGSGHPDLIWCRICFGIAALCSWNKQSNNYKRLLFV